MCYFILRILIALRGGIVNTSFKMRPIIGCSMRVLTEGRFIAGKVEFSINESRSSVSLEV